MLIAFEGIDGSGKGTHAELLRRNLVASGTSCALYSFPCYATTFFGAEVGKYLNGKYGTLSTVPVEFASLLYAGDRFEMRDELIRALEENDVVICDRYTPSNLAHQAGKTSGKKRHTTIDWIERVEYEIFKMPRPDLVIWLDMPVGIAQSFVLQKKLRSYTSKQQDLHEESKTYLVNVRKTYSELSVRPGWYRINCGARRSRRIEDIHGEIVKCVEDVRQMNLSAMEGSADRAQQ